MEIKYYAIRRTLVRCSKSDFFDTHGRILENTTYYLKDESTYQFKDRYYIGSIYGISIDPSDYKLTEDYYLRQINYLVASNLVFKLTDNHNTLDFNFKLYLKSAESDDLFTATTNWLLTNTTYFCINNQNQIVGPLTIFSNHSGDEFRELFNKGLILVPLKKQTFEPFKFAAAS